MKYSSEIMYISNIACLFEILGNYVLGVCVLILLKKKLSRFQIDGWRLWD